MYAMTGRQKQILSSIIEQYAEVASPVGSQLLAKVFGVSSATIRAEMAELERGGYITQPHTSAGRVPTDRGYRFYVNNLSQEKESSPERRAERAPVNCGNHDVIDDETDDGGGRQVNRETRVA